MADLPSDARDPAADHAHRIMESPRIPGYEIEARIGAGGMATVFRGHDERLRRPVALKVLAPALAADDGFRRRFIREARAAAMVDDPHIIPVFEAGESNGLLFIAMRFVAGGDVRSLLSRSGAMSAGRAAGVVSAVGSALDAAHRAGLVHRDVKPANMLIDVRPGRPDHVYLSDFGLSKGALSSGGVTRAGQVVGTPAYLAPEQAGGGKVDGRTDQYSLACVAYELLTGVPPFVRDDAAAMIYAHLCAPPPLATARQPALPSAVDSVLARAMAKNPEQRYLTCQEFAGSLRAALGLRPYGADPGMNVDEGHHAVAAGRTPDGNGAPCGSDRVPPGGRTRTRRRAALLSLAALALAALTVAGVVVATRAPPSPEHLVAFKSVPGRLASVSAGPHGQFVAAGYACGGCGTPAETDRPLIAAWNGAEWSRLAVPAIGRWSRLTGVSISTDGTIYAVGYTCLAFCGQSPEIDRPLILRWHGGKLSRFAKPSTLKPARLTGVSVAATGAIFAVGFTCKEGCGPGTAGHGPLILRSDGSRPWWVSSLGLPRRASLSAVSAQPDGDAWVAGEACTSTCKTLILHGHGSAWRPVTSQSPGQYAQLLDISTTANGSWASGWYVCKSCGPHVQPTHTLTLHWDGRSWSRVKSPSPPPVTYNLLNGISGAPGGTAWAAGIPHCEAHCASSPVYRAGILRWDGSQWSWFNPSPAGDLMLNGVAAAQGGDVVAAGYACISGCATHSEVDRTALLRWNGSRWSVLR